MSHADTQTHTLTHTHTHTHTHTLKLESNPGKTPTKNAGPAEITGAKRLAAVAPSGGLSLKTS